jgi:hypothetical protein
MRGAVAALVLMLAACANSSAPLAHTSPSPSANPASTSPSATPMSADDLISVAAQIYPLQAGRYVTCDSGYGGSTRYAHCPVTARLGDRLLTVFSGYISAPEPLGGGQDPEWPAESITADPRGTGGVAHVVLTKPTSPSSRYDLVIILSGGKLLVDDIYCTGADPSTSSIYVDGWMNRFSC